MYIPSPETVHMPALRLVFFYLIGGFFNLAFWASLASIRLLNPIHVTSGEAADCFLPNTASSKVALNVEVPHLSRKRKEPWFHQLKAETVSLPFPFQRSLGLPSSQSFFLLPFSLHPSITLGPFFPSSFPISSPLWSSADVKDGAGDFLGSAVNLWLVTTHAA